jgi:hypothetical protein
VQPGDALVTSGIGARFPPGLLVGRIVDVEDRDDLTLRAVVQPAVSLGRVEHVAVLIGRENPREPLLGDDETVVPAPARRLRRSKRPKPDPLLGPSTAVDDMAPTIDGDVDARDDGTSEPVPASGPRPGEEDSRSSSPTDAGVRSSSPPPEPVPVVPPTSPPPSPSPAPPAGPDAGATEGPP